MELVIEGNNSLLNIRILGALLAANCQMLQETILELSSSGRHLIQIDLSEMPYVDTSGIGTLVTLKATLKRQGGNLHIYNAQPNVVKLLETLKLNEVLRGA